MTPLPRPSLTGAHDVASARRDSLPARARRRPSQRRLRHLGPIGAGYGGASPRLIAEIHAQDGVPMIADGHERPPTTDDCRRASATSPTSV